MYSLIDIKSDVLRYNSYVDNVLIYEVSRRTNVIHYQVYSDYFAFDLDAAWIGMNVAKFIGRPGSGKSLFMLKIMYERLRKGYLCKYISNCGYREMDIISMISQWYLGKTDSQLRDLPKDESELLEKNIFSNLEIIDYSGLSGNDLANYLARNIYDSCSVFIDSMDRFDKKIHINALNGLAGNLKLKIFYTETIKLE